VSLAELLLPLLPGGSGVVAFVGAGGKSSALLRLAGELEPAGRSVLVTTTTHMAAPGAEWAGLAGSVIFSPDLEAPWSPDSGPHPSLPHPLPGATLLFARAADDPDKVKGIHPSWIEALRPGWDFVLVEADGSKRLPVKAPGEHEPVLPPGTDLVVGVVGLDCLGRAMDSRTVHRPELFSRVTGCAPGSPIEWEHLEALSRHPEGLFKGAGSRRVILLNKVDRAPWLPTEGQLAGLGADLAIVASLEEPVPVEFACPGRPPA
jgi:probable selenium-dependent hydroxylase accessory protein YqeC